MTDLTPGLLMIIAAGAVPYLPHHFRQFFMLGAIVLSALQPGQGCIGLSLSLGMI